MRSGKLFALLALPVVLASVGIVLVTFQLLDRVAVVANRVDHDRTSQVIHSAFAAEVSALKDMVSDNALWDDAAKYIYQSYDEDWIYKTWGYLSDEGSYNAILLIDPDQPRAISAYAHGKKIEVDWPSEFGPALVSIFKKLPRDVNQPTTEGAILLSRQGPAVVAAAFVYPTTAGLIRQLDKPRAMVMVRYLDGERLQNISDQYVVQNLRLGPDKPNGSTTENEVRDINQNIVAYVSWSDLNSGEKARKSAMGFTILALGFLVFVVTTIGFVCWTLVRTIAKREAQAAHSARVDHLTGLPNRLAITEVMTNYEKSGMLYAVAFADLDGFKEVNDNFDHETGDQLLKAVAVGMQHLVPASAMIARLGGDEFIALFRGDDALAEARKFAVNFVTFINMPFDLAGRYARVGVSVGLAEAGRTQKSPAEVMRQADIAMYAAKASGKNCHSVYDVGMDDERESDARIAESLSRYMAEDRIHLVYQPIVEANTHRIVAVEALARWPVDAPSRVAPDKFVAIAEQKGLIDRLGESVLRKACQQLKHWQGISINVNVSPLQLNDPEFAGKTLSVINACGVDPKRVELELTESNLLEDIERTSLQFEQLRKQGIRIALDDFGAGFASLGYLQKLEFDSIKIDKVICNLFASGNRGQKVLQATALLAKGMASKVVAEGIESAAQGEILHLVGSTHLQGYFFYKPKSAAEITELLQKQLTAAA